MTGNRYTRNYMVRWGAFLSRIAVAPPLRFFRAHIAPAILPSDHWRPLIWAPVRLPPPPSLSLQPGYFVIFSLELSLPVIFMGITGIVWSFRRLSNSVKAFCASKVSRLLCSRSVSNLLIFALACTNFILAMTKPKRIPLVPAIKRIIGLIIQSNVIDIFA